MQRRFIWCFGLLAIISSSAIANGVSEKIDKLIKQQLPHATVGILIKEATTNRIIYSKNADKLLSPASGMKLFVAAAAWYQWSPTYSFLTTLSQKKQNIYVTFTGSPSLTEENVTELLGELKKHHITRIQGNVILDVSRYKEPYYQDGDSFDDSGWYYVAPDTAVIVDGNAVTYDFNSAKTLGGPVQVIPKKASNGVTIINQLVTVSKEEEQNHCHLYIESQANNTLRLFGCLAQSTKPETMALAVPNPPLWVSHKIKEALQKQGIVLQGRVSTGRTPLDTKRIAIKASPPLSLLITHMLQESDNLYAGSLMKQLGYVVTGQGTHKEGAFAIKNTIAKHTHVDMTQLELADGVGTRYNSVTAEQMVVLLTDLYQDANKRSLVLSALPKAGVSGTLQGRMKGTALEGRVFAKTGTMHDVSSLSGYVIRAHRPALIFSIIINGVNQPIAVAKSLEDTIIEMVSD